MIPYVEKALAFEQCINSISYVVGDRLVKSGMFAELQDAKSLHDKLLGAVSSYKTTVSLNQTSICNPDVFMDANELVKQVSLYEIALANWKLQYENDPCNDPLMLDGEHLAYVKERLLQRLLNADLAELTMKDCFVS